MFLSVVVVGVVEVGCVSDTILKFLLNRCTYYISIMRLSFVNVYPGISVAIHKFLFDSYD